MAPKNILIFDGVCSLCNGAVSFLLKRDREDRFRFAAFQSDAGKESLKKIEIKADPQDTVILISGDHVFIFSDAALECAKILGWPWKLFYIFKLIPKPLRDFCYKLVSRFRYRLFGRLAQCRLPGPEEREKFL